MWRWFKSELQSLKIKWSLILRKRNKTFIKVLVINDFCGLKSKPKTNKKRNCKKGKKRTHQVGLCILSLYFHSEISIQKWSRGFRSKYSKHASYTKISVWTRCIFVCGGFCFCCVTIIYPSKRGVYVLTSVRLFACFMRSGGNAFSVCFYCHSFLFFFDYEAHHIISIYVERWNHL